MTKYYKRGLREFYAVSPEKVIRIVNKAYRSDVTISMEDDGSILMASTREFMAQQAMEGQEITKEEFAEQFKVASRLIVIEP